MDVDLFPGAVLTGEVLEHLRPDLGRVELVEGRLERVTPTNSEHARMVAHLAYLLRQQMGEDWIVLAGDPGLYVARQPDTIRGPDLIACPVRGDAQRDPKRAFLTVVPELVIEVISPSNAPEDIARKMREYLELGSTVWVVDIDTQTVGIRIQSQPSMAAFAASTSEDKTLTLPNGHLLGWTEIFLTR